ncbi:MAG: ABC transporter ATP-binding protein [Vigna little leaf phytoplasma]|nr:ABC transporter ATP-binding protein [Vigna little leaf phytoplasma]
MTHYLIELKNVTKIINNHIILNDINLQIKKNEFVTLLGPSGCGKTTILKIIGGFTNLSSGDIYFNNKSLLSIPPHRRLINTVFQKYALFPHLNVFENIAFGLTIKDFNYEIKNKIKILKKKWQQKNKEIKNFYQMKMNQEKISKPKFLWSILNLSSNKNIINLKKELKKQLCDLKQKTNLELISLQKQILSNKDKTKIIKEKVLKYLKLVGLKGFEKREINELSGGQQQRVAIARALINEPQVLLLDEPLAALDLKLRQEMQYELKEIQKNSGITFIFVTHNQEEALTMSDKVVVINQGEIQQIGTPQDIYNEPINRFTAKFIGESNLIQGIFKKDFLVYFDEQEFSCVDFGFEINQKVDILIRPEDIDIVDYSKGLLTGIVNNILFKGVHWEVIVKTKHRNYIIHTTDFVAKNTEVGIFFQSEDLHVMEIW